MPAVTPQFVMDLESRMRQITENEYLRLTQSNVLWWNKIAKVLPSQSRREIVTWIVNGASLEDQGEMGGNIAFEDKSLLETEFTAKTAGKGLKLRRQQFEDLDGNGLNLATEWSMQMGAQHAYWPQRKITQLLKLAETSAVTAYDGENFFSTSHPVNPNNTALGTYSNLFTSVPIDVSVTADEAQENLATVFGNIASMKMPNGADPRFLRPAGILCGANLYPRLSQLTSAKFLAADAKNGGGGSADYEGFIRALGYSMPILADELTGFESDTTYFVLAEQISSSQLGAFVYVDREPFSITYYTGRGGGTGVDAALDRSDELEWHSRGRNVAAPGHPFLLFKCKAA